MPCITPRSVSKGRTSRWTCACNLFAALAIALVASLACARWAQAQERRCDTNIVVHAHEAADAGSVCAAAVDAIGFLGRRGLKTDGKLDVFVVDKLPAPISAVAFGGYIHSERRGYLLAFSRLAERGTVFGLPFDLALYRSLATHEIAHAIAAANFRIPNPPIEVEEYIAYATMFSTMPAKYRDAILARFSDERFDTDMQINRLTYLLDPFRFGVLAYKHFTMERNGAAFLQQVLTGRALPEFAF